MTYVTLAEVRSAIGVSDYEDDAQLQIAMDAAEQMIDGYCGRSFEQAGTAATTRIYVADQHELVYIDDCTSITLVESDPSADGTWTQAWAAGDWQAEPLNGRAGALAVPYDRLRAVGDYWFPVDAKACVRVTATWGWTDVPAAVTQAALQSTVRLWKRLDTPLGFGGGPDTGLLYVSRQIDGDVAQLLAPYRRGVTALGGIA